MMEKYVYQTWYSWVNKVNGPLLMKCKFIKETFSLPCSTILQMGIIALGEEILHILSWLFICMEALDTKFEFLQLPQPCFSVNSK